MTWNHVVYHAQSSPIPMDIVRRFEDYTRRWQVIPSTDADYVDFPDMAMQQYGVDFEKFVYDKVRCVHSLCTAKV